MTSAQIRALKCAQAQRSWLRVPTFLALCGSWSSCTEQQMLPLGMPSCQGAQQSRLWKAEAGAWEPTKGDRNMGKLLTPLPMFI